MDSLSEAIKTLSGLAGVVVADCKDEHERWWLYQAVMDDPNPSTRQALQAAVCQEEDENVALSIVLRMLERVPKSDRALWIDAISDGASHEYAHARAVDLENLETLLQREDPVCGVRGDSSCSIESWSDWLQLQLAAKSSSVGLLRRLAEAGRTKRIRRSAAERLTKILR
ncbi:MAG: hypothetical protein IRZ07_21280 [Microbispora sp.]|nr:hypothetical protein [Microbispora sp.]